MHDAVSLEARGVPTAAVVTTEFRTEAYTQVEALGMRGLEPAIIDHPLSTLTDDEISARAHQAVDRIRAIWLGSSRDND